MKDRLAALAVAAAAGTILGCANAGAPDGDNQQDRGVFCRERAGPRSDGATRRPALPNSGKPFVHLNGIVIVLVESSPVSIGQASLSFLVLERMAIVEVDLGEELRGGVDHFR